MLFTLAKKKQAERSIFNDNLKQEKQVKVTRKSFKQNHLLKDTNLSFLHFFPPLDNPCEQLFHFGRAFLSLRSVNYKIFAHLDCFTRFSLSKK